VSVQGNKLFKQIDETVTILTNNLNISYFEALIESCENLLDGGEVRVENGLPTPNIKEKLEDLYKDIQLNEYESEELRRIFQLLLIKGTKEEYLQPNHQMTPDSLGTFIAYLIEAIVDMDSSFHLADLSIGTGNLLYTVYHFLNDENRSIQLTGVDNDDLLISLASTSSALQQLDIQLIHDDALQNLLVEPVDVMVSDLPVGYYPLDSHAAGFNTSNETGHSFSHHLLIEQGMNYMKDGGFGFYLVPSNLFDTEEGSSLLTYIQSVGHFQGFIHLPKTMFQNEQSRKSILIVQKQSKNSKQAKEILLANAPDFDQPEKMKQFIGELNIWKKNQFN